MPSYTHRNGSKCKGRQASVQSSSKNSLYCSTTGKPHLFVSCNDCCILALSLGWIAAFWHAWWLTLKVRRLMCKTNKNRACAHQNTSFVPAAWLLVMYLCSSVLLAQACPTCPTVVKQLQHLLATAHTISYLEGVTLVIYTPIAMCSDLDLFWW